MLRLSSRALPDPAAIIFIGMAAVGKSTLGRRLAEDRALPFVDTDHLLAERAGCSLEELLHSRGAESFCDLEEEVVRGLSAGTAIISTGGSVVYRPHAIAHLQRLGMLVWLDAPAQEILARHTTRGPRGLIWLPAHLPTMEALIAYRTTLYRAAADYYVAVSQRDS